MFSVRILPGRTPAVVSAAETVDEYRGRCTNTVYEAGGASRTR
jgi:hypothetical protein